MVLGGFLTVWGFLVAGMMLPYGFPDGLYGVIPGAVLILLGVLVPFPRRCLLHFCVLRGRKMGNQKARIPIGIL